MNFLLVLLLIACGGGEADADRAEAPAPRAKAKGKAKAGPKGKPVEIKGTLDFQDEGGAVLRPCGGGEAVKLKVGSGDPARVREELGADVDDVYVEMRGHEQADGVVVIRAFDVAVAGFDGCAQPLEATILARGANPTWSASVEGDKVTLEAEGAESTTFEGLTREGRSLTYTASADGKDLKLTFKRARCKDATAQAFYPWNATVESGGTTYTGCAWGTLPKAPAASKAPAGEEPAPGE